MTNIAHLQKVEPKKMRITTRIITVQKMAKCDNLSSTHNPTVLNEDNNAILAYCKDCGAQERIGKDQNGEPEHRAYSEFFKRDVLQPPAPLYYKYQGAKEMHVI